MNIIGENIHIISKSVREAIETRDKAVIQNLARRQVDGGAAFLDLNIGPRKKDGIEVMQWMVETVREVTDIPLSLDTTNATAVEAGLKMLPPKTIINSTNADPERMRVLMPMAAKYDAMLICLTLRATGLPTSADERAEIAAVDIMTAAAEYGLPLENIILDPLVMTVNGTQSHGPEVIKAVQVFKTLNDPPLLTTCGLSNVSNSCPKEIRPLLHLVYLAMLSGAGIDRPIVDALDSDLRKTIQAIEKRDSSTPVNRLYLAFHDAARDDVLDDFDFSIVDPKDPEQVAVMKTAKILLNRTLYAHGYLNL
ncbi:MAG: dihydropteroate synthase [Dehalococcoidia bacterium]|nr:dihydropteroate synthase [Dehalococcoidia bacterium]